MGARRGLQPRGARRGANTTVVVKALMNPAWKVEVELEAVIARVPAVDR